MWDVIVQWWQSLEWSRLWPEFIGKALGFLAGFAASWFLLFRRRLKDLQRFQQGDSDDLLFQAHYLLETGDKVQLVFRNVVAKVTLNQLYDNPAARDLMRDIAGQSSLNEPILPTQGTLGFEVLNDAAGFVAGHLAASPFDREVWLFAMTCEDRAVVRKRCIRCFLIRPLDLEKFIDWDWVSTSVAVERPWHWFRLVALHRIARHWQREQQQFAQRDDEKSMPLVDKQREHRRLPPLSLGLPPSEVAIAPPYQIEWTQHAEQLKAWGVELLATPKPQESVQPQTVQEA